MPTISTDILDIAYENSGPAERHVLLLTHGGPDDATISTVGR